jgi:prepilin-type N-terminal cleavage/methylation domain-containing protein
MRHPAYRNVSSLLRDERGFTLVEMLAAVPLMLIIFFAVFQLYEVSVREQSRGDARVRGIVEQKNALERMSRELRDSVAVRYRTSEIIDAQVSTGGSWVRYDCSGTTCRRSLGTDESTYGSPVTLISNVHSAEFHTLSNSGGTLVPDYVNPTFVSVTLRVSVRGANNPIVLNDGFNLRNLTTPG